MADGIRVLYVDDEPALLEIGKLFLEDDGQFSVDTITSAPAALALLHTQKYDAIIADYQMPKMNGIEFLKEVRTSGNTIPFILFTGRGREEVVIQALNEGADFYLQKGGEPQSQFTELAHKTRQAVLQRRAQVSIRDHERREADIINFLPDATFAIDTRGRVIAWNRAMEKMTGVKSSEILGKDNYAYAIPFYHERRPILIDLVLNDDPVTREKYPGITRDGTTFYSEITIPHINNGHGAVLWFTASPLYDTLGNIVGAIESIREITERKRIEDEITFKNLIQSTQQEISLDAILIVDESGKILNYNQRFIDMWGIQKGLIESRIDEPVLQFVGEQLADPEAFLSRVRYLYDHKEERSFDELLLKDGRILERFSAPVLGECDKYFGRVWFFRDITERKRAEEELRQSEARLKRAEEVSRSGSWQFRLSENTVIASDGARALYGLGGKQWTIDEVQKIPLPEYRPYLDAALQDLIRGRAPYNAEFRIRRPSDGTVLDINSVAEYDPVGNVVFGIIRDITERKRAEDELRKSEERYRNVVEVQTEFISRFRPDGTHVFVNEAYCGYFGLKRDEIIGQRFRPNIPPEDQERVRQFFASLTPDHPVGIIEHRIVMPDGTIRWQRWSDHAIFDPAGTLIEYQSVGRDTTEQKREEQARYENEQRLTSIYNTVGDSIFQLTVEPHEQYRFTSVNSTFCRVTGLPCEHVIGKTVHEIIPQPSLSLVLEKYRQAIREKAIVRWEEISSYPMGQLTGEVRIAPIFDASGTCTHLIGSIHDITKRKYAECALKERLKERDCLFNISVLMELPAVPLDEIFKRTVTFLPPAWQFPEITEACIVVEGQHFGTPRFRETSWMQTREIVVHGNPIGKVQVCYLEERPPGDEGPFIKDERQLLNAIAERLGHVIESRRAEEALNQANKRLLLLSGITRHDINNQLTVLAGCLRIIEKKKSDPAISEYIQRAVTATQHISSIILFTKTCDSIGASAPEWQNIRTLVEDAAKDMVPGRVRLTNDLPADGEIYADPLIVKVFYNLMDNAVRHGGKITTIRFSVEKPDGRFVVVCEDDGDGVPADEKEQIFEHGFGKNTGLGLTLSREILLITGITIRETGEPGRGARFEIAVPERAYRNTGDHR